MKKVTFTVGVPGSGKSTLAKKIAGENGVILSTDDFFMVDGVYKWTGDFISEAHKWNQGRFYLEIFKGTENIVVDNTNLETWQMFPYVDSVIRHGYDFELVEPKTKWKNDPEECAKKNTHNVGLETIKKMLDKKMPAATMEKELREKFKV